MTLTHNLQVVAYISQAKQPVLETIVYASKAKLPEGQTKHLETEWDGEKLTNLLEKRQLIAVEELLFDSVDLNHDGEIDRAEWTVFIRDLRDHRIKFFKEFALIKGRW